MIKMRLFPGFYRHDIDQKKGEKQGIITLPVTNIKDSERVPKNIKTLACGSCLNTLCAVHGHME